MKSLIILLLLILFLNADKLHDVSPKLECKFTVNNSGNKPLGNFFSCRENGCNENSYIYYNKPKTYTVIKNFIVNFKTKTVSYDWNSVETLRELKENKEPIYFLNNKKLDSLGSDLMENIISYKKLKTERKQDSEGRTLVFIYSEKEDLKYLLYKAFTHVKSKFNIELNQKFSNNKKFIDVLKINFLVKPFKNDSLKEINSLTFYKDKVLWVTQVIYPFSKAIASVEISYGNCIHVK